MDNKESFNKMVEDVQLVDDHVLLAKLRNGHWSRLDLDFCLGNADGACSDLTGASPLPTRSTLVTITDKHAVSVGGDKGQFQWGGTNFSETATDIRLTSTGHDPKWPMLHAHLRQDSARNDSGQASTIANTVNLSEFIRVVDGELTIDEEVFSNPRRPSM